MNQKGSILIFVILGILIITSIIGGSFYLKSKIVSKSKFLSSIASSLTPLISKFAPPVQQDQDHLQQNKDENSIKPNNEVKWNNCGKPTPGLLLIKFSSSINTSKEINFYKNILINKYHLKESMIKPSLNEVSQNKSILSYYYMLYKPNGIISPVYSELKNVSETVYQDKRLFVGGYNKIDPTYNGIFAVNLKDQAFYNDFLKDFPELIPFPSNTLVTGIVQGREDVTSSTYFFTIRALKDNLAFLQDLTKYQGLNWYISYAMGYSQIIIEFPNNYTQEEAVKILNGQNYVLMSSYYSLQIQIPIGEEERWINELSNYNEVSKVERIPIICPIQ
ncbi:MAG: hypothetical protein M1365_10740 [Actinobacteria bacterium]|nr:hypothetical protein [Actinomycetota bacterium]